MSGLCGVCMLPVADHVRSARATLPVTTQGYLRTCDRVHRAIERLRQGIPDTCRFCDRERQPGRTVCEVHLVTKDPCVECEGPVLRREGKGRQPMVCAGCDLERAPSKRREYQGEAADGR